MDKEGFRRREDSVAHLSDRVIELRQYVDQFYKFAVARDEKIDIVKTEAVLAHMDQQITAFEEMPDIFKRKLEKVIDGYKGLEKELRSAVLDYKQAQQGSEVNQSAVEEKRSEKSSPRDPQKTNLEEQPSQATQGSEVKQSAVAENSSEKSSPRDPQKTNVEAQPQQPEQGSPKGPNVGWVRARMREKDPVQKQEQDSQSTHHESVAKMGK